METLDVSKFFCDTSKILSKGEMIHDNSFSLYHTMTAMEAGDPKMDITYDAKYVPSPQQRLKEGQLKIDNFTNSELYAILRQLLLCEVNSSIFTFLQFFLSFFFYKILEKNSIHGTQGKPFHKHS